MIGLGGIATLIVAGQEPTLEVAYNELTIDVSSNALALDTTFVQLVLSDVQVVDNGSGDDIFVLLILDENGEPLLDVNGAYIIGG